MKKILKKFFFGFKEWFADAADNIRLFIIQNKIKSLEERLDWEDELGRYMVGVELKMYKTSYQKVLERVVGREIRHGVTTAG